MVCSKEATSAVPLACNARVDEVSPCAFDSVLEFLRRGLRVVGRGVEAGSNEALWQSDADPTGPPDPSASNGVSTRPAAALRDPRITVSADACDGLIDDGVRFCVDRGGIYGFTLNLSDARGAIVGLPLLPRESHCGGVVYHCDGPSDHNGDIRLQADTRAAAPGGVHALVLPVAGLDARINLKVYEFVQARLVNLACLEERVRADFELFRRNDQAFGDLGGWRGYVRLVDGTTAPFLRGHSPDVVPVSTGWLPAATGTLQVRLSFPSSLDRLLTGQTDFPMDPPGLDGE